jgi:ribose transport system permease protein
MSDTDTTTSEHGPAEPSDSPASAPPPRGRAATIFESASERVGSQAIVYLIFIAIVIFFIARAPSFATLSSLANIGRQTSAITIVAVGMTMVIISAEIDLSVGSTVSITGSSVAILLSEGWPVTVAVLAALAVGTAVGAVNGLLTAYLGVPSFLVTLGMMEALGALASMMTHTEAVPITSVSFTTAFGANSLLGVPIPVWWAVAVALIGIYVLRKTVYGRWVFATGGNRGSALYSGIKTKKVVLVSFVISGFLAALAGLLLAGRSGAGDPTVGNGMELSVIAAVILGGTDLFGGRGSVLGTVIGALFIGVVGIGLILLGASSQLQEFITGVIIIGAVSINRLGHRR